MEPAVCLHTPGLTNKIQGRTHLQQHNRCFRPGGVIPGGKPVIIPVPDYFPYTSY